MTCKVALCAVCRLAGLAGCPFRGAALPLAEAEKPRVIYRSGEYLPVFRLAGGGGGKGSRITRFIDPTDWS